MTTPDGRIPEKKLLVVGPFTRPVCFREAPISEEVSKLQGRIVSLETDLKEAKRNNSEADRALRREIVKEKLADLPTNETVLLARATLAKNELVKEQKRHKQTAAEADNRVQQKQLEMEGELRKLEADWKGRMERRNADVGQLRARNRWLWEELHAARERIRRTEVQGPPRNPRLEEGRPAGAEPSRRRTEAEVRVPASEVGANLDPTSMSEFCALIDQTNANMQIMRSERDKLLAILEATELQLADARDRAVIQEEDLARAIEARTNYQGYFTHQQEQINLLGSHGREMAKKAEAAEAEVQRLQAAEARREKEKVTATSKVEGMDVCAAYFFGFDECRSIADMLCPGIGKELCYPLAVSSQRNYEVREAVRGAGTSQEPIDLNDSPPPNL